jgi:membrane AbrB-like protein
MFIAQVLLGMVIAQACDRELARRVATLMWPMILSCVVLILAGLLMSYLFYRYGIIDFPTAYIAGSPGAMHVLVAMRGDMKADVALVAAFHSVRLIIVSVTAPLIFKFFIRS